MRQAIVTKYLGPTNFKPSRVKAIAEAGTLTMSWDHGLRNSAGNHDAAARALAEKLGWTGRWYGGGLPDHSGNCYVWSTDSDPHAFEIVDKHAFVRALVAPDFDAKYAWYAQFDINRAHRIGDERSWRTVRNDGGSPIAYATEQAALDAAASALAAARLKGG